MQKEEILKLSMLVSRNDNFFLDDNFSRFERALFIDNCDFQLVTQKKNMEESLNIEVTKELITHYIHFIIV